jgi:hypothetical protein
MSKTTYTVETLKAADLEVDRRVQRDNLKAKKVEEMVKNFNPDALGVLTVSRRKDHGLYIIDGWHRNETVRIVTDNTGEVVCHVFTGLTVAEEAQMFLDINYGDQPNIHEKFKASLVAGDPESLQIDQIVRSVGWAISGSPNNGNINAIKSLQRLQALSTKTEAEPNLVLLTLKVITRAWGNDRFGTQAAVLDGLGRVLSEYGSRIDFDSLVERLAVTKGGPQGLIGAARNLASTKSMRTSMAVADLIVGAYNKGRKPGSKGSLPPWGFRS